MDYPARIDIQTPQELDRWRALAQWILAQCVRDRLGDEAHVTERELVTDDRAPTRGAEANH